MGLQAKCDDCQLGKHQHRTDTISFQREEITEGVTIKVKNRKWRTEKPRTESGKLLEYEDLGLVHFLLLF